MSALSNYLENEILDHMLGGGDFTRPASVFIALFTAEPSDDGGGTEAAGGDYARVEVVNNLTNFPASVNGVKSNGTEISFPSPGASWGTIKAVGVFDALSGGNLLMHSLLPQQVTIASGDTPSWPIGTLSFSIR